MHSRPGDVGRLSLGAVLLCVCVCTRFTVYVECVLYVCLQLL